MAIIKRSDSETEPATAGSLAVQETAAAPSGADAPATAPAERVRSMTEALPSALEPELRRIIDTAVARVAAIELDAIREARELTQRSEREAREALRFALDRAFNLINTLELLAATVGGMAEALKIELDDAIEALRKVPEPESELARELAQAPPAPAAAAQPDPEPAAAAAPPPAAEPPVQAEPSPAAEQAPQPDPGRASELPAAAEAPTAPEPAPAEAPPVPEPAMAEAPPARQAVAAAAETPPAHAPAEEATEATPPEAPAAAVEEPRPDSRRNGYPPAERHAESLAAAAKEAPSEPEDAAVVASGSEDGRPAVPARRRGLVRRLFTKG